ncbi:MAG: AAA family ATPase [Elusimicrobia bacterium]|nr:AAA family ATPase [Elusimicrobiota bacterium]
MSTSGQLVKKHPFYSDRPITDRQADRLGRRTFAEALAGAIKGWSGDDSLVVALYGPWGCGKSSIKNMVLDALNDDGRTKGPDVVEFNPWQFAGQDQIAEAFFAEIGTVLGRRDRSRVERRLAASWKLYAKTLQVGSSIVDSLRGLGPVLLLVGFVGFGVACLDYELARPLVGLLSLAVALLGAGLKWGATFAERLSGWFSAKAETHRRTLHEAKDELSGLLRQRPRPLLVVMDDVDRLSADEIRLLFQLVKANADLPRLVYLLLFQRDLVEESLETLGPVSGRDFLKKIVQVGFDVPIIDRPRLERVLFEGLNELLATQDVGAGFDEQRWANIFIPGLRPYFGSLRDVYRFLSTLDFHIGLFRNPGSFEVNAIDLIALEVLRVFEPQIYRRLSEAKPLLTDLAGRGREQQEREQTKRTVETMVELAPEANRPQVREILGQLFPKIQWIFDNYGYGSGFEEGWFRQARVCHPDIFDRYFGFAVPEGDLTRAELDKLLSLVSDRDGLVAAFRALNQRGLLGVAVDRLEAYKEKINLDHAVPFITALFDIGDELPEAPRGIFVIEPEMHASRIIHWYLKREPNAKRRAQILQEAMTASIGLHLPVLKTDMETDRREKQRDPDAYLVEETDLESLKTICLTKIRQAAATGALSKHRKMAYLLYRWKAWGSPDEPKTWATNLIQMNEGLLSFLTAFLQASSSQGMGDYVPRIHWRIKLKDVEEFVTIDELERRVGQLTPDGLEERQRQVLRAVQRALKRRREGKPDEDWARPDRDDEDA